VRTAIGYYGRAHLSHGVGAMFNDQPGDTLAVPIVGKGRTTGEFIACEPVKSRWRWLRRGAVYGIDLALAAALP